MSERRWDLRHVLIAPRAWGDGHVLGTDNEPLRLVDVETGEVVEARHLRHRRGPAFDAITSAESEAIP